MNDKTEFQNKAALVTGVRWVSGAVAKLLGQEVQSPVVDRAKEED
jgi:hypothetical protein